MSTQESSSGYGWDDLEIALIATVPGIERTSHGNMLLTQLRNDREKTIRFLQELFGNGIDEVLDGIEVIVDAELEMRASLRVHNGNASEPDSPRGFINPPEELELDTDEEADDIDAELAPGANIVDNIEYSDVWAREGDGQE